MPFRLVNLADACVHFINTLSSSNRFPCLQREIFGNHVAANGDSVANNKKMIDLLFDIRSLGAHWPD